MAEKRLIDANDLIERLKLKKKISEVGLHRGLQSAMSQCDKAPTVDAVEVVRCKDCRHMERMVCACFCKVWGGFNGYGEDGFCSYGERRTNG